MAGPDDSLGSDVSRNSLAGTVFESWPGRMFVIEVVHVQSSKLFKCLKCAVLSIEQCTLKKFFL